MELNRGIVATRMQTGAADIPTVTNVESQILVPMARMGPRHWSDENVCDSAIYLPAGLAGKSDAVAAEWGSFVIDSVISCKPDSPFRP